MHPTQSVKNFSQCFHAILYPSHLLTAQNFTEIVPEKPLRRGLNVRGIAKYSDVGYVEDYNVGNGAR